MAATLTVERSNPSDDLLVRLAPAAGRIEVRNGETLIAASDHVVELHEPGLPVRYSFPREDVNLDRLRAIDTTSACPFKGIAGDYWALADDVEASPVAWSYTAPTRAFSQITGHVGFYDTDALTWHSAA